MSDNTVGNNGQLLRFEVHTVPLRILSWISGIFEICTTSVKSVCSAGHLFFKDYIFWAILGLWHTSTFLEENKNACKIM